MCVSAECEPGTYIVDTGCEFCPRKYYTDVANSQSCDMCPFGTLTTETGSASLSDCESNYLFTEHYSDVISSLDDFLVAASLPLYTSLKLVSLSVCVAGEQFFIGVVFVLVLDLVFNSDYLVTTSTNFETLANRILFVVRNL